MKKKSLKKFIPEVCIAVLNWNGREHLKILIPSLLDAVEYYPGKARILILNNPSPHDDIAWLHLTFPSVDTVNSPDNDYLYSYNWLMPQLEESFVVLLNNDLKVAADFLESLLEPFENPNIFAVGACSLEWGGSEVTSAAYRLGMHHGWPYFDGFQTKNAAFSLYAVGGFFAVDRLKFLEIGGFDRLFHPAYGEDADLCLRAWLRGWRTVYQPKSIVWHREGASWDGEQADKRAYLMTISHYLVSCRYCRKWRDRLMRWIYLPILGRQRKKAGDLDWAKAIKEARSRWSQRRRSALKFQFNRKSLDKSLAMIGQSCSETDSFSDE